MGYLTRLSHWKAVMSKHYQAFIQAKSLEKDKLCWWMGGRIFTFDPKLAFSYQSLPAAKRRLKAIQEEIEFHRVEDLKIVFELPETKP